MNEEEKQQLANTVVTEMDLLRPEDIRVWLSGYVSTHPKELVHEVNLLIKDDPTYKDVVRRMVGWHTNDRAVHVSWIHVKPETEASLRDAAAWGSASLCARNKWDQRSESGTWSHYFKRLGIPDRGNACRDASTFWKNRVKLNKNGVALFAYHTGPWPGEAADVVSAIIRTVKAGTRPDMVDAQMPIVLCDDGRVLEGLPTWPRTPSPAR